MPSYTLSRTGEYLIALASLWFIGGLFTDGWAHNHVPELESFFTPWHAVFYSGYFVLLFALLFIGRGKSGFRWPLIGAAIFFVGGIGDMAWHQIFGVENDIEALHSPTHLVLATGMTLMLSGNLLSWMSRDDRKTVIIDTLPMILSAAFVYSIITFMTQYAHLTDMLPAGIQVPRDNFYPQALPMTGFIIHFVALMGILFTVMRTGRVPTGFLTIVLSLNLFAMGIMREHPILCIVGLITGIGGDVFLSRLYPYEKHMTGIRVLSFAVPALFLFCYFGFMITTQATWWSIHMWAGSAFMAGVSALLLSFVAWPPAQTR
jgi:hypothetical protein